MRRIGAVAISIRIYTDIRKKERTYSTHIEDIFTAQRCQMIKRKSYSPPGCWHIYNCILKFRYDCTFRGCYGWNLPYHQRLSSLIVRRRASHAICMGVPVVAYTGLGLFFHGIRQPVDIFSYLYLFLKEEEVERKAFPHSNKANNSP